jgi:predicted ferric reductase
MWAKRHTPRRGLLAGLLALITFASGAVAMIAGVMKPGTQGRLVVFADALGFAALSALALQIVISGRWAATTRWFGLRSVLSLHRQAGVAVLALVVLHVGVLVVADPSASRCWTRSRRHPARGPACWSCSVCSRWPQRRSGAGACG